MTLRKSAPHAKPRWLGLGAVVTIGLLLIVGTALATVSGNAGFEGADGNLVRNAAAAPPIDWNDFAPTTWDGTSPYRTSTDSLDAWEFRGFEDAQNNSQDTVFAGGTKQDNNCATVNFGPKPPNKDDLERIYVAWTTGSNDHTYLALGWVRIPQNTTNASAHVGFEFNQDEGGCPNSTIPGNDGLSFRSTANGGDMLIVYDFEGSSTDSPTLKLLRWQTSGTCEASGKAATSAGCWVFALDLTGAGYAEAKVNTSEIGSVTDAIGPTAESLGQNEFGEAIIDLTDAGVFDEEPTDCLSFGRAFGVSRSSGNSAQAQMKDLVGPGDISISNCGRIVVNKTDDAGTLIAGAEFTVTPGQTEAGSTATSSTMDEVETGVFCLDNLLIGEEYSVEETVVPDGYDEPATNPQTFTVEEAGTCEDVDSDTEADLTFINPRERGSILVEKVDGSGEPLDGASFALDEDGDDSTTDDQTSIPTVDGETGLFCIDNLLLGDYTVVETVVPDGYTGEDPKAVSVDSASTCADRVEAADDPDVTFTNERLPGAIRIYKDAKDASAEGGLSPLAGVTFTISGGDLSSDITTDPTDANGYTCVDGLTVGQTYTVTEEGVPTGYYLDTSLTDDVTISVDATCDDEPFAGDETSFTNVPLSQIEVIFSSLAGDGITVADIVCKDGDGNEITLSSGTDDEDEVFTDLLPNDTGETYTCTIFVDP